MSCSEHLQLWRIRKSLAVGVNEKASKVIFTRIDSAMTHYLQERKDLSLYLVVFNLEQHCPPQSD